MADAGDDRDLWRWTTNMSDRPITIAPDGAAQFMPVWQMQAAPAAFRPSQIFSSMSDFASADASSDPVADYGLDEDFADEMIVDEGPSADELLVQAYDQGVADGIAQAQAEMQSSDAAAQALAQAVLALRPQLSQGLCAMPEEPVDMALMLAETVERLVRQIVGEVSFDSDILVERATRAAVIVAEAGTPAKMRLNPSDHGFLEGADLPVEMVSDARLAPGTVLLETADGWIEDGSDVGIEKLRIALDRMGVPR
jgi:flagellar assembly protein FliH